MSKFLNTQHITRILITRTDRIGDLVLSTPVFSALRRHYPKARIVCLTFLENRELIEGHPDLDAVMLYDKHGSERGWWGQLRFARKLAKERFDVVVHLHATNRMHVLTYLAGIPVRIGYTRKASWALTHGFQDRKAEGLKHEAAYNFDLIEILNVPRQSDFKAVLPSSPRFARSLEMLLGHQGLHRERPWVVLNPSASCPSKIWPPEYFGDLVRRIAARYDVTFIALGRREDRPLIEKLKQAADGIQIHDLSGRLSLGMLRVLLADAALLISNDSGPVHVANAAGTPVISIFGRNQPGLSPRRWGPLDPASRFVWKDVGCEECLAHNCRINFLCLEAISAGEVMREVEKFDSLLKERAPGHQSTGHEK